MTSPTGPESGPTTETYLEVQASDEFAGLRSRFRRWVFPVTAAFLAWYLLYVVMSAWARDFMGQQVIGNINVGLVFGLLQFVSTFYIAWAYERHMNRHVDPAADRIQAEIEGDVR
jgi:uncharacterized membrane protein (DUF485 family)